MDLSGGYWDRRDRATGLALSWKVPDDTDPSYLEPPSSTCDATASCGGPGEFPCDAVDRRLQRTIEYVNPGCTRTCDDIPINVFRDQCEKGKSLLSMTFYSHTTTTYNKRLTYDMIHCCV